MQVLFMKYISPYWRKVFVVGVEGSNEAVSRLRELLSER